MPASRSARATTFAPRSCPSRPGLATSTRAGGWRGGSGAGSAAATGAGSAEGTVSAMLALPALSAAIVLEEPLARLAPEPAGGHEVDQQGARPVLVVAEALVEHAHDVQAHIEPDQVGQRQ